MLRKSLARSLALLPCLLALVTAAPARDLAVVEDNAGQVLVLGADAAGYHQERVPLQPVKDVQVQGGLATLTDGVTTLLYGMTEKGITHRRIDWDLGAPVESLVLGDRIAVARSSRGGGVMGLTGSGIAIRLIEEPVGRIEVAGRLAYLETSQASYLFAPTDNGVVAMQLPGRRPRKIDLARNQAFVDWGQALYLYTVTDFAIQPLRLDRHGQRPQRVHLRGFTFDLQGSGPAGRVLP